MGKKKTEYRVQRVEAPEPPPRGSIEWQVSDANDNRHVFYRPEDVQKYLRNEHEKWVASWDPLRTSTLRIQVLRVIRWHHDPFAVAT